MRSYLSSKESHLEKCEIEEMHSKMPYDHMILWKKSENRKMRGKKPQNQRLRRLEKTTFI